MVFDRAPDMFQKLLEQWSREDPEKLSRNTGIDYEPDTREFCVRLMNVEYKIRHPDFRVTRCEREAAYAPLEQFWTLKLYVLYYLLRGRGRKSETKRYNNVDLGVVPAGIYSLNNGTKYDICVATVDYALTCLLVAGELERAGIPCNLIVCRAGGLSVVSAWCAGTFNAGTIAAYFKEAKVEERICGRILFIPGRIGFLAEELGEKLPGWRVIPTTDEARDLGAFLDGWFSAGESV